MIETAISYIQPIIIQFGVFGVFFSTLLEEAIAPIPSALIPLIAGFLLLPVELPLVEIIGLALIMVALPVSLGVSIGSLVVYSIGYFGGKPAIERTKKWTGLSWEKVEKIEKKLIRGRGDEITLFILRLIPIVPGVAISGFCGIARYPVKLFVIITLLGSFLRAFALGVIGWYVQGAYVEYSDAISNMEKQIFAVLILVIILYAVWHYFFKKRIKR